MTDSAARSDAFPYTDRQRRWWFAHLNDDGSPPKFAKAVANTGAQMDAFHGSPHSFDKFQIGKSGTTTDSGFLGRGLYFSTDQNVAAPFANKYSVKLKLGSSLHLEMTTWGGDKKKLIRDALGLSLNVTAEQVSKAARDRGFDSVILDYSPLGYKHQEIVVFDESMVSIVKKA